MTTANPELVYATYIKPLPVAMRAQLLVLLANDLSATVSTVEGTLAATNHASSTFSEIIAQSGYRGGSFTSADEVDAYMRAERDSWES